MWFPLRVHDISIWLAIISSILLVTSEVLSHRYGQTGFIIEKKKLRRTSIILGLIFLFTLVLRIYQIIMTI